jgi:phosphate:Na+ symporter
MAFTLGLGVFFLGLGVLRRGVLALSGPAMAAALARWTQGPWRAAALGVALGFSLQSASLATVVLMELVEANLLDVEVATATVLGVNVGSALTIQLLVVEVFRWYGILLSAAVVAALWPAPRVRAAATALWGLGLLFAGLRLLSAATRPLSHAPWLMSLTHTVTRSPWGAGLLGLMLTAVAQSSSLVNGLLLSLARAGSFSVPTALALMAGSNVGSGSLALLASLSVDRRARPLAVANALVNVAGLAWVLFAFGPLVSLLAHAHSQGPSAFARAHILYNLLGSAALFPVYRPFALVCRWLSDALSSSSASWEAVPWRRLLPPRA